MTPIIHDGAAECTPDRPAVSDLSAP
jgi:hypothetical protein